MARGPTKGSKLYRCRNERCERFRKNQYIAEWAENRCKSCGSEDLEEVTASSDKPPVSAEPIAAGSTDAESEGAAPEPTIVEPEEVAEEGSEEPSPPAEDETPGEPNEPQETEETVKPPEPTPPPAAKPQPSPAIHPKDGDKVVCNKCGWAVFWNSQYHRKVACGAAGCGSTDLRIEWPVEGK